ncbi:iminodiacetate oxidase [Nitzschia inconspicua]|uniref:Iminodiacetate oxidase n=1 Tax=Nitzschia inconspicua TaxID=303405 RepID=A0A9K3L7R6_9STRA|nr:iminodiacetate oxidase [Nitzschia inconspicua]
MISITTSITPNKVLIAGSGVIGTSTAFFLAKEFGISTTLIDPSGSIAPAASGKAGGFLALDWNDYSSVGPLTRRSFTLHQNIADLLGASTIQYRRLTCASIRVGDGSGRPKGRKLEGIEWAEGDNAMADARSLGDESTIAQVHPKKLCQRMWEHVQSLTNESSLVKGSVVEAVYEVKDGKKQLVGAKLDDETVLEGDALLFSCGPWTADNMFGTKYHSLVVPTTKTLSQCVFFSGFGDPEVYVRPDNTAYCTGFPDPPVRVTERPGQEEVRSDAIAKIQKSVEMASSMSDDLLLSTVGDDAVRQACYLPSTADGSPMMGPLPDQPQTFVCTGHTCWGILMGPASGEAMANLIARGDSPHVDLTPFDPARFGSLSMVPQSSRV